ncbi:MAG: anti-sigma factor family protein [Planctomycetota bacterium]
MKADCPGRVEELSALVDDELVAEGELEIRRHLDTCPTCEALHGDLEALSAALETTAGRTRAPHELARRVMRQRPTRFRPATQVSAAVIMLAAVLIWGSRADRSSDARMVSDHRSLVDAVESLDVRSSEAEVVANELGQHLPFRIELASAADAQLRGGQPCQIGGIDAAYLQYERQGEVISVFAYPGGRSGDVKEPRCRDFGEERLCSWERDEQTVTVVGSRAASLSPPAAIRLVGLR